jgi:sugar O-acyltransferase (sialic acid O-acetyltransferase NeuD family)
MNHDRKQFDILGFVDDNPDLWGRTLADLPVLGGFGWLQKNWSPDLRGICGIGNTVIRKRVYQRAQGIGLKFTSLIHPSAQMSKYVELGQGVVITAGTILTTQIEIHDHVFLNLSCTIGHDAVLEPYANCAPSCNISGDVRLKEGAHLGTGVQVIPNLTVGEWTRVGAGAVVIRDLPSHSVAVGVPAKVIKTMEPVSDFSMTHHDTP